MTVSIVLPCHNSEDTLVQTLDSVMAQTCGAWRIVAVDDRSTDSTAAILARFAERDDRIRIIDGPGQGAAAARNAALNHIDSELVAFLDADDIWAPTRLSVLGEVFRTDQARQIAFTRYAFFTDEPYDGPTRSTVPPGTLSVIDLLHENAVGTMSNLIVRRGALDCAGTFREDMTHGEDREWLVRAASLGLSIRGVPETLMQYRTRRGGLSTDLDKMYAGWRESVRSAETLGAMPSKAAMRSAEAVYLRYLARRAMRLGFPPRMAASYAVKGVARSPGGFFSGGTRGALTLGAAMAGLVAPGTVRDALAHR